MHSYYLSCNKTFFFVHNIFFLCCRNYSIFVACIDYMSLTNVHLTNILMGSNVVFKTPRFPVCPGESQELQTGGVNIQAAGETTALLNPTYCQVSGILLDRIVFSGPEYALCGCCALWPARATIRLSVWVKMDTECTNNFLNSQKLKMYRVLEETGERYQTKIDGKIN